MRFLADENIPLSVVEEINRKGFKIIRIDEIRSGLENEDLIKICTKYDCILLTFNKAIIERAVKENIKGVILFDFIPSSLEIIKDKINKILDNVDINNKIIILKKDKIILNEISKSDRKI